ncbi:unnamed protein product [Mycena citricolor]|uniref:Uncharacterized protein n=1 Tax=Mycena citricolor TaxID=2018698 RepID=A0AAD2HVQ9_9AGAR|nr:unnamed protein product [Mycena citricolor]
MSPSTTSARLSSDIRALTDALTRISGFASSLSPSKHQEATSHRTFHHVSTLLNRDGSQKDMALSGVSLHHRFLLFAVCSEDESAQSGKSTSRKMKIEHLRATKRCTSPEHMEALLNSGLESVPLRQHILDLSRILEGFAAYDIPAEEREDRQSKCLIFILQRSFGKIAQRFNTIQSFFLREPWWKFAIGWQPSKDELKPKKFSLKPHIAIIYNALSPGTMPFGASVILDTVMAGKCVQGLGVLLDVIDGKIWTCRPASASEDSWERLNTTIRMLYSLLYESDILRHILYLPCFSLHIQSLSTDEDRCDGPFLFRQLQRVVAWHRALLVLSGTKVVRAAIPVDLSVIDVPPSPSDRTAIMKLVHELYPASSSETMSLIDSYLLDFGVYDMDAKFPAHHKANLLGVVMAADSPNIASLFDATTASDPRRLHALKDVGQLPSVDVLSDKLKGLLQALGTSASCCYMCDKLASLLSIDPSALAPSFYDAVHQPWSPPLGSTVQVLRLLRSDLMDQLRRYLDWVVLQESSNQRIEEEKPLRKIPGQGSMFHMIETIIASHVKG